MRSSTIRRVRTPSERPGSLSTGLALVLLAALSAACGAPREARGASDAEPTLAQVAPPAIRAASQIFVHAIEARIQGAEGLDVRFTLDGSDPGPSSSLYAGPMAIADTSILRARSFRGSRPASAVAELRFTRVEPYSALDAGPLEPGLVMTLYSGKWDRLPDFASLVPRGSRVVPTVELGERAELEHTGHVWQGFLRVPRTEVFLFRLSSDDGSRLWIDGERVVDNDGLHAPVEREGLIPLEAGLHELSIEHFNAGWLGEITLTWASSRGEFAPVPAEALGHLSR